MKAVVCRAFGPPESLAVDDVPAPVAAANEVLISVKAASVNFPDVLIIQNKYQIKPSLPFSPGSEVSGVITSVGSGIADLKAGDRVLAFTTHGGFAEQAVAERRRVYVIPDAMDFVTATAFGLTYATADHALRDRGRLTAGESLLVLGAAGGVGLAAVEIGKVLGARVIACASSAEKLEVCRRHGADDTIDYTREDLRERVKVLTDGRGVDVVYDAVGGSYTEAALRSVTWRGRLLVVGFAAGDIPKVPLNIPLLKGSAIVGVYWGEFARREPAAAAAAIGQLFRWFLDGKLKPHVDATLPLARASEALTRLANRDVRGKLVLTT